MRRDARLPPSHIALQLWQRQRLQRGLGAGGTGALSPGLDFSTPHWILYDFLSLALGSLQEGFFPPSPFWVYQQKISAAAKLGRWGTQHKEMAHPLTQPVRCCWSFPCEFAQALWEGKFLLSVRFLHPGFLMCSTNSRRCWDTS